VRIQSLPGANIVIADVRLATDTVAALWESVRVHRQASVFRVQGEPSGAQAACGLPDREVCWVGGRRAGRWFAQAQQRRCLQLVSTEPLMLSHQTPHAGGKAQAVPGGGRRLREAAAAAAAEAGGPGGGPGPAAAGVRRRRRRFQGAAPFFSTPVSHPGQFVHWALAGARQHHPCCCHVPGVC
jgi:hypothetical protein